MLYVNYHRIGDRHLRTWQRIRRIAGGNDTLPAGCIRLRRELNRRAERLQGTCQDKLPLDMAQTVLLIAPYCQEYVHALASAFRPLDWTGRSQKKWNGIDCIPSVGPITTLTKRQPDSDR